MRRLLTGALVLALVAIVCQARAADKPDPTGTWKWTTQFSPDKPVTLKLKLDGKKLTGTYTGLDGKKTPIQDAEYKDGEVSFTVAREMAGMKMTVKYKGKLSDDSIDGTIDHEAGGQSQTSEWHAKRDKN